jgi:CRISPR-associated protein Cas2
MVCSIDRKARLRAARYVLKGYATGGQRSVFECFLSGPERRALLAEAAATVDAAQDRFFLVRLDPRARIVCLGVAVPPEDPAYFYVG